MRKVTQSQRNITPYGGLNFIYDAFSRTNIAQYIDNQLGCRNYRAKYSYSDLVLSLFGNCISNGEYIADLELLKEQYWEQLFDAIPSADTVEYCCQELKVKNKVIVTDSDVEHQINYNKKLNTSLVNLCVYTNQLKSGKQGYVLDYDNVVVETQKQDARKSYKMTYGYHPGIAFIGNLPVHIENRNGNTPARYGQKELLENCFNNLDSNNISIEHYRGDSASYQQEVIELLKKNDCKFYIRNMSSQSFISACSKVNTWEKAEINYQEQEIASVEYQPFGGDKTYRVVVTRSLRADRQTDIISGKAYNYYGIITNNSQMTNKELILFYNQRGNDSENGNKNILNDFNLKRLPFMDMDTNTVYMGLMAICSVLFEFTKQLLVFNNTEGITLKDRVKKVCYRYITVCATFVKHARENILKVFSSRKYRYLELII